MAYNVNDQVLMSVGVAVLVACITFDIYKAYQRGAKWLPGNAVVFYTLCTQLAGYLDAQNVSIASRHKVHDLEVMIGRQMSIDSSRLVLLLSVGYVVPALASNQDIWVNIAALCISLSTHIAIELYVSLQSHVTGKQKVTNGQSGIWLITTGFFLLYSILGLFYVIVWAIVKGRFLRDNLGSRIDALFKIDNDNKCPIDFGNVNTETSSWEKLQSEMLKAWIVVRVCQPEYVLRRSLFSAALGAVVTFLVVFFGVKVIFLRSRLQGSFPMFTIQCLFIILIWSIVLYRSFIQSFVWLKLKDSDFELGWELLFRWFTPYAVFVGIIIHDFVKFIKRIESKITRHIWLEVPLYLARLPLTLLFSCLLCWAFFFPFLTFHFIMIIFRIGYVSMACVSSPIFCIGRCVFREENEHPVSPEGPFPTYKEVLELLRMPRETAESLWKDNVNSFSHLEEATKEAYNEGKKCQELKDIIALSAQNSLPREALDEMLEPLKSVEKYFPLLKKSFGRITADSILIMMRLIGGEEGKLFVDAKKAYKKAIKLIDVQDCPDNVRISFDAFKISNLEAFELRGARMMDWTRRAVYGQPSDSTNTDTKELIREQRDKAEKELKSWNLLGQENGASPGPEVLDTSWTLAAKSYGVYKVCNLISNRPGEDAELLDDLMSALAYIIASCVRDSPRNLAKNIRKWAKDLKEDKITEAVKLTGFARGILDNEGPQRLEV
ncbi:hypothetical protein SUGI_0372550 [Cryptomeria japonica]|nr:hypothetical protein SUGI_0372550 [Cryptomeria japonica]